MRLRPPRAGSKLAPMPPKPTARPPKPPKKSPSKAEPFSPVLVWLWAFALAPQALPSFILQSGLVGDLVLLFYGYNGLAGAAWTLAAYFGSAGACLYVAARLLLALGGTLPAYMRP